ncbi:sodium/hydrogen exchanger family domain-containing protein [Ditylenchus destructor]|uniref:Sodium/hydrogen exchanger n=1 Tax=Ditylenchus destructor TaxID=166010 RepID=A0AAD4N122_9BILA|nr:sodium/hydrogen exchanger family domain-containing protein [Ditylenchus destructor]
MNGTETLFGDLANSSITVVPIEPIENTTASALDNLTTTIPFEPYHGHEGHVKHRIQFFETQFEHVQTPLTFAFWFFTITIAKIVFHRLEGGFKSMLPDSALLLVLGSVFGGICHLIWPEEEIYLQPDWFFLYLLPPIALDAGYFLPNKDFFQNIGTITVFAVFGTLWNIASIGLTLYGFNDYFHGLPTTLDLLLFSTLISAVDPVAVICVFEEIHVNQLLYICVFGESLLNDAVTIVLYHTFTAMAEVGPSQVMWSDYLLAMVAFLWVSLGGILVGIVWAIITGFITKWATSLSVVQPLTCLLFPYLAYLCAEGLGLSGILAIVVCGMLMKQYIVGNISEQSQVTVNYFMKTLSSSCEALIFVFLGLSAVSKNHDLDIAFIAVTLISCLVFRFVGVIGLTYLLNLKRTIKIPPIDQFIMGYGGIRGAVCYGLVMSLNPNIVCCRNMFATTTVIVILFTVFVQGGTIKQLVRYLKVKQHDVYKKRVFDMIADNVISHFTGGIEGIAGLHGDYWMRMTIERFNDTYIKPYIMVKQEDRAMKIVKHNEEIQANEAITYLKQHGSFAGMPTVQSRTDLSQQANAPANTKGRFTLTVPRELPVGGGSNYDSIPRNKSISMFVREKFAELNKPQQMYSRHFLDNEDLHKHIPSIFMGNIDDKDEDLEDDSACYKTYPYSKSCQKDLIVSQIRKASRSGNSPPVAHPEAGLNGHDGLKRPKFMITSDPNELSCSEPHNTYSIGRFDVVERNDSEHNPNGSTPPLRKSSFGQRSKSNGMHDESSSSLLPIEEQDEQTTHTSNL